MAEIPKTIPELFEFYYDRYKPIYNRIQTFNEMPVELVFEIAAAWDHLSRHWKYGESEAAAVDKASRHVKRAVFDACKLLLKHAVDDYDDLKRIDTSLIDNGDFDRDLRQLMAEIRIGSIEARTAEGFTGNSGDWHDAFVKWDTVYRKLELFYREFYHNKNVEWAKRKTRQFTVLSCGISFVIGFLSSLAVWYLTSS